MEKNNVFNSPIMKVNNPSDYKTYKTRQGKVGGYKSVSYTHLRAHET